MSHHRSISTFDAIVALDRGLLFKLEALSTELGI